jgi:YidC/Oxa1 family membrane protein insertase
MDIQRNLLTISLLAICAILYFKWVDFSSLKQQPPQAQVLEDSGIPQVGTETSPTSPNSVPVIDDVEIPEATTAIQNDTLITVTTDMVVATINTKGGIIQRLELRKHLADIDNPDLGYALLKNGPAETFIVEDGLASNSKSPNHQTTYLHSQTNYELGGEETVVVPLTWVSEDGIKFVKTFTFKRDNYVVDINYKVTNASAKAWKGKFYGQFNRTQPTDSNGGFGRLPSYTGAAIYEPEEKYQKIDFGDIVDRDEDERRRNRAQDPIDKNSLMTNNGWVAMMQHYFVGAWLPADGPKEFFTKANKDANPHYRVGYLSDYVVVDQNQSGNIGTQLYLGSKESSRLHKLEDSGFEGFSKTIDYGFLTIIAEPLFIALNYIHKVVGNWGWAIILLTILIKAAFYPLSAASYRSMGKMKKLQPRMATLKERYKDDRQKFQVEMMALYKKEKVNPAGGCLPMLIQIPVFIALYWVLMESVEIRHAPFALWWVDLSAKDPYYVLPILMGLTQFLMMKLNPAPMDDIQKKVMMIMPFALMFLIMTFPQGLLLYSVVNNILTMTQQWFNYRQQDAV